MDSPISIVGSSWEFIRYTQTPYYLKINLGCGGGGVGSLCPPGDSETCWFDWPTIERGQLNLSVMDQILCFMVWHYMVSVLNKK